MPVQFKRIEESIKNNRVEFKKHEKAANAEHADLKQNTMADKKDTDYEFREIRKDLYETNNKLL